MTLSGAASATPTTTASGRTSAQARRSAGGSFPVSPPRTPTQARVRAAALLATHVPRACSAARAPAGAPRAPSLRRPLAAARAAPPHVGAATPVWGSRAPARASAAPCTAVDSCTRRSRAPPARTAGTRAAGRPAAQRRSAMGTCWPGGGSRAAIADVLTKPHVFQTFLANACAWASESAFCLLNRAFCGVALRFQP